MRRWLFTLVVLGSALGGLAACAAEEKAAPAPPAPAPAAAPAWQEEWDRVLAEAKKEGTVVVWGFPAADVRDVLTKSFEQKYGIKVEYQGLRGEGVERVRVERAAGQYLWDIHIGGTSTAILSLMPMGTLEPLEPALILPEVKDPKSWWGGRLPFVDKAGRYLLGASLYVTEAFYYNPQVVKPGEIKSYRDLLDPKWKGRIATFDPSTTGPGNAKFMFLYKHPALGPDFIRALAKQDLFVTRDHDKMAKELVAGKYALIFGGDRATVRRLREAGQPIATMPAKEMREGGSMHVGQGGLSWFNKAAHPNAAKVYINWFLSKEGQTAFSQVMDLPSGRVDTPKEHLEAWQFPQEGYISLDGEDVVHERRRMQEFFKEALGL